MAVQKLQSSHLVKYKAKLISGHLLCYNFISECADHQHYHLSSIYCIYFTEWMHQPLFISCPFLEG